MTKMPKGKLISLKSKGGSKYVYLWITHLTELTREGNKNRLYMQRNCSEQDLWRAYVYSQFVSG